jgi:hypothetical protein
MTVLRIILLVVLQALMLRDVAPFGEWTQPQWALWALLLIPPHSGPFGKLIAGFAMGLGLDLAMGSYGQHMVAGTLLGGVLPTLHRLLAPREGYEVTHQPTLRDMGSTWMLGYLFLSALIYHLALMVVSHWYWHLIPSAFLPALTSAMFTTLCCLMLHMMVYAPERRKSGI